MHEKQSKVILDVEQYFQLLYTKKACYIFCAVLRDLYVALHLMHFTICFITIYNVTKHFQELIFK